MILATRIKLVVAETPVEEAPKKRGRPKKVVEETVEVVEAIEPEAPSEEPDVEE